MPNINIIGENGERYAAIRLTQGQLFDVIPANGWIETAMDYRTKLATYIRLSESF